MIEKETLTKLQVAEREIQAAVRLLFDEGDPVVILLVAAAARGIVSGICDKKGIRSFSEVLREEFPNMSRKDIFAQANRHANWFKHADEDADDLLTDFDRGDGESILFWAVTDFGSIANGLCIEAQVFQLWFLTLYAPETIEGADQLFPGLRELTRIEQRAFGKKVLEWALQHPDFRMQYSVTADGVMEVQASSNQIIRP